jgi:hypothetical protein
MPDMKKPESRRNGVREILIHMSPFQRAECITDPKRERDSGGTENPREVIDLSRELVFCVAQK